MSTTTAVAARHVQLAVERFLKPAHVGGRFAGTVRSALDTQSLSALPPHLHDGKVVL
jgi:hypothetical protein